jgi:DNA-binding transcriptional MocR family regulator
MRLNFTNATVPQIDEGIARLGRVMTRALEHVIRSGPSPQ